MYLICVNHKKYIGLKYVFSRVLEDKEKIPLLTSELVIFLICSFKTIKLFEEIKIADIR